MLKNILVVGAVLTCVGAAFAAGWYLREPQKSNAPSTTPTASSGAESTETKTQAAASAPNESSDVFTRTHAGAQDVIVSNKLRFSVSVPAAWMARVVSGDAIALGTSESKTLVTLYGARAGAYVDPTFLDGTNQGFVALLGLSDDQTITIGTAAYTKLKTTNIDGHEGVTVKQPNDAHVTWVRSGGLNWYIRESADLAGDSLTVSHVIASIKLK